MGCEFDENVNEKQDDETTPKKSYSAERLRNSLDSSKPSAILSASLPKLLQKPLFAEFQKIAVISFTHAQTFNSSDFEEAIVEIVRNRTTVSQTNFVWETQNGFRSLKLPLLGWEIVYKLEGSNLFVSNSSEMMQDFLVNKNEVDSARQEFNSLSVVRLENYEQNFTGIFKEISPIPDGLFVGNVSSFISLFTDLKEVRVSKKNRGLYLSEEFSASYQTMEQ